MSSQTYSERQPAKKVFAPVYRDANHQFTANQDQENAPQYVLLPTGERINRIHICGTLVEVGSEGEEFAWGTVEGPSGEGFSLNAGQYQEKARQILKTAEPPVMVAATGKARVNNNGYSVIQATYISPVTDADYDLWVRRTAEATVERFEAMLTGTSPDGDRARNVYGESDGQYADQLTQYRDLALEAVEQTIDDILAATEQSDTAPGADPEDVEQAVPEIDSSG
jgi:RPA family protein